MAKLRVYQMYKFKKGKNEICISDGDVVIVKTNLESYQGSLIGVGNFGESFDIETNSGDYTIFCEDVVDISLV